jgi:hypothetical protein
MSVMENYIRSTTMKEIMPAEALETQKELARKLRREGQYVESVTQKIAQVNAWLPREAMVAPAEIASPWIRDCFKKHRQVLWNTAVRPVDFNGDFLPKGTYYGVAGYEDRDGESVLYEQRTTPILTLTAVRAGRDYVKINGEQVYTGFKGMFLDLKIGKKTKGNLRNGLNAVEYSITYGRRANEALWTYADMEQTPSVIEATRRMQTQKNSTQAKQICFYCNVTDKSGRVVFTLQADMAYLDAFEAAGFRCRMTPPADRAEGGEE